MEYKGYNITQYQSSGTWLIFQEIPGHGKQVVQLAETETEAKQKVDQLISGEIMPLFYSTKESPEADWDRRPNFRELDIEGKIP